nr:MAG TPA: hypothetical protein [Caudoviricetes sp.]
MWPSGRGGQRACQPVRVPKAHLKERLGKPKNTKGGADRARTTPEEECPPTQCPTRLGDAPHRWAEGASAPMAAVRPSATWLGGTLASPSGSHVGTQPRRVFGRPLPRPAECHSG